MNKRPILNNDLSENDFRSYYYLKKELIAFCKENHLPTSGNKIELTNRIAEYLTKGIISKPSFKKHKKSTNNTITENSIIEPNISFSEANRAFFKSKIGKSFSFNLLFQKWLKENAGKTYQEAIAAYYYLLKEKKSIKNPIGKQFEYNTYIRDFFLDNPKKSLNDAITCWKYKKSIIGHNRYERTDLKVLNDK